MFEVVGQDIISGNMGFIGTDSDRLYRMGAAEKTEDVTVNGNPAVLDNATGKPFKALRIYGRSEQMTTTGAQLFDAASIKKNNKIQVEISDNSYTIQMTTTINESGSSSNKVYIAIQHVIEGDFSGKTVTLSYDGVNSDVPNEKYVIGLMYDTDDGRTHYLSLQKDMSKSISVTLPENTTNLTLRLFITEVTSQTVPAGTYTVTIQGVMLTEGSEKKDWEPYTGRIPSPSPDYPQEIQSAGDNGNLSVIVKNPDNEQMQSVSFSTPNGLPGILVSAGGNYTDETGQQWICDEVDLGREVYVQRVKVIHIDITRYTQSENGGSHWYVRYEIYDSMLNSRGQKAFESIMCTTMQVVPQNKETAYSYPIVAPYGHADRVELRFRAPKNLYTTIQDFQDIITGAEIRYPLATPIETPLTADEIAAYKSLRSYRGTTIVEAEDKAGISVTYKRNAKAAEKEVNILHADLMAEMEELDENSEIV
ncbi:hypothetical protein RJD28_08340 [Oscillospiraceae bacterium NTUH-002-81]|nr:hypothetical protein RJD28_08340 [Oscillospiraceae bacterium NTUH-002-81]